MSRSIKRLKDLLTKGEIPSAFSKLIRDANIYSEKPLGTIKDFERAYRSSKTNPALRYVMGLAGILDEPEIVDRSLRNMRKKLTFKVSPRYTTKRGKINLSHFEVKGYSRTGAGEFIKINTKAKAMMMGTPVDSFRARIAGEAISPTKKLRLYSAETIIKNKGWDAYADKYHDRIWTDKKKLENPLRKELKDHIRNLRKSGIITSSKTTTDAPKTRKPYEFSEKEKFKQAINKAKKEQIKEWSKVEKATNEAFWQIHKTRIRAWSTELRIRDLHIKKQEQEHRKKFLEQINKKIRIRPLTASERARMMRAIWELQRHYQGLLWVLHSTIKLNDKRRQFWYIEDNFEPVYEEGWETIKLHGFPEHMQHYITESGKFWHWIQFFDMHREETRLLNSMTATLKFATEIEGVTYESADEAQDQLDELLRQCTTILHMTTAQSTALMGKTWMFSRMVAPALNPVPKDVPKHRRHPTPHKIKYYAKNEENLRSKIEKYVRIYGKIRQEKLEKHITKKKPQKPITVSFRFRAKKGST